MTTLENGSNHECIPDSCSACGKLFSTRFQMTREEAIALYNLLKAELDVKKAYWDAWKSLLMEAAVKGDENFFLNETR